MSLPKAEFAPELHLQALQWLLESPPLLAPQAATTYAPDCPTIGIHQWSSEQQASNASWLKSLDPAALAEAIGPVEFLDSPPLRLGRYAERLLLFYLQHGPCFELLEAHVPLRNTQVDRDHTTLGELDFLVKDPRGQHLHWELAIKLFLCEDPGPGEVLAERFMGPQRQDNLDLKLHKLFGRQLRHRPPVRFGNQLWQPRAYACGWMFYPWAYEPAVCSALAANHEKGWWITMENVERLPGIAYLILPRLRWMQRAQPMDTDTVLDRMELANTLQNLCNIGQGSVLVAELDAQSLCETRRFFIRLPVA